MKILAEQRILILMCFCFLWCETTVSMPNDYEAVYSVKLMQADGTLRAKLEKNEGIYTYSLKTEPTGFWKLIANGYIHESTDFKVIDEIIKPMNYELRDTIRRTPRESEITFDWINGVMRGFYKDRSIDLKIDQSILTRILLQIEIMHQKQSNTLKDKYSILDRDKIKEIEISSSNRQKVISVPFGSYTVVEVTHQSKESNRINTLWLAPELDFIPIRMEQSEDNKLNFEANLVQLNK